MNSALRIAAWVACLALCLTSCAPEQAALEPLDPGEIEAAIAQREGQPQPPPEKAEATPEKPKPEPEQPKPEPEKPKPEPEKPKPEPEKPKPEPEKPKPEPEKPKPEPEEPAPPPPAPPPKFFLIWPQERTSFTAAETAEVTLVVAAEGDVPGVPVAITASNDAGRSWTAVDSVSGLTAGRHSITYALDVGVFGPGAYKVAVRAGEQDLGSRDITVVPSVPITHFRIAGWLEHPPKNSLQAVRWGRALGLNTLLLQDRSPWRSDGVHLIDSRFVSVSRRIRSEVGARPLEMAWTPPPFIQIGDLLTGAGLQWVTTCAVSGGRLPHLRPDHDFSQPQVVSGGRQRIQHRLLAERRFANCVGVHFTNEAALAPGSGGSPFGNPARLAAYKARYGVDDVPWRQGAQRWEDWTRFVMFRAEMFGECLTSWADAARAVDPNAIATSQLERPTDLAHGVYPPLLAKGLPTVTTSVSIDGPAGAMLPAIVPDLARAGNWGKPLWLMPELASDADVDEVRIAVSLGLARKIDGVVYPPNLDYHLDQPGGNPFAIDLLGGISGVNHMLTRFGDLFLALEKPRSEVALLYSATEHMARMGANPVNNPNAPSYPWTLKAAYEACMFAHFPATFLTEDELLAGAGNESKVILVVGLTRITPEVKAALEAANAAGTAVVVDTTTTVKIEGARTLDVAFPDLNAYDAAVRKKAEAEKGDPILLQRDVLIQDKLIYPLLPPLRTELKRHIQRDYTASDPDIIMCHQECGGSRYIYIVNNTQHPQLIRLLKQEFATGQTQLTFRDGDYALYDVLGGSRLFPQRVKGHPTLNRILPPGAVHIFAQLPQAVAGVQIQRASLSRGQLSVRAKIYSRRAMSVLGQPLPVSPRKAIDGAVPIEVVLRDPSGRERLRIYRAHTPGGYRETLPMGALAEPGRWTLVVRELLSGESATKTVRVAASGSILPNPVRVVRELMGEETEDPDRFGVRSSPAAWAARRGQVAAYDGKRIAALLASAKPLSIIVGTNEEAEKAEALAAALRTETRTVEVKLAGDLARPRTLGTSEASTYLSPSPTNTPMPDVRSDCILLGDVMTHSLLQAVHSYGVVPRTVTVDYPGRGGALLCHVASAFEPDTETVVAAASDPTGVDAAIAALRAAAAGSVPATSAKPLSGSESFAELPKTEDTEAAVLTAAWRRPTLDIPTCAASTLRTREFTVGFYDGTVATYNSVGKVLWTHRCGSRVRGVARTLDDVWSAAVSYPDLAVLNAQGRPHFAVATPVIYRRADQTAVAMSPDGGLTAVASRIGSIVAYDFQGNKAFAIGEPVEGEEQPAPTSPFGTIRCLAISPKTGVLVAGGELGTAAIDPVGQELWTSKDLKRVTALATSLGEEQTVAIGSRDGIVACVGGGGTVIWSEQPGGYVLSVCFRGQTQDVLAASLNGTLTCYDKNGKVQWTRRSPVGFRFVGSSLDGGVVAAAELSGRVVFLDAKGRLLARSEPIGALVQAFALTADGQSALVGTAASEVLLFNYKRAIATRDEL